MKRKFLDENGRLFGAVSVVDVIALLLVALVALGAYLRFCVLDKTALGGDVPITYTLTLYSVRDYSVNGFQVGDTVYDWDGVTALGTITQLETRPATTASTKLDGTYVMAPIENRYDLVLTVEGSGTVEGGQYTLNRTYTLADNIARDFTTKYVAFTATVSGLTAGEEA